jgi:hypothetical protein
MNACGRAAGSYGEGVAVRWLVRLLVVVMTTIVVFAALGFAWVSIVVATGGGGDECGGGSCGTLGDWDYEHGEFLFFGLLSVGLLSGIVLSRKISWERLRKGGGELRWKRAGRAS